jgi:hypothetical protein
MRVQDAKLDGRRKHLFLSLSSVTESAIGGRRVEIAIFATASVSFLPFP